MIEQSILYKLSLQIRKALEVFLHSLDKIDLASNRTLLEKVSEEDIYQGSLSLIMGTVFLLAAEGKGLLPLGNKIYDSNYSVFTLARQIKTLINNQETEAVEMQFHGYNMLLATFKAFHEGVAQHELNICPIGSELFNIDKYSFLQGIGNYFLLIDNYTVLFVLDSLQYVDNDIEVSYEDLAAEQLGQLYETLLDYKVIRAKDTLVTLEGKQGKSVKVKLSDLEGLNETELVKYLQKQTGRTKSSIEKSLKEKDLSLETIEAGSLYLDTGSDRADSGAHYTPTVLVDEVVKHTLDPLVYPDGELISTEQLLDLKIVDLAMGSGAFLLGVCRYLGKVLVEMLPSTEPDKEIVSKRMIAERCIYGVDMNPMAVQIAKISIGLETLLPNQPLVFLDHAFKTGDSLVGVTVSQLQQGSLKDDGQMGMGCDGLKEALAEATRLRERIASAIGREEKEALHIESEKCMASFKEKGDVLIGTHFND